MKVWLRCPHRRRTRLLSVYNARGLVVEADHGYVMSGEISLTTRPRSSRTVCVALLSPSVTCVCSPSQA